MKIVGLLSAEDDFSELNLIVKIFILEQHIRSFAPNAIENENTSLPIKQKCRQVSLSPLFSSYGLVRGLQ